LLQSYTRKEVGRILGVEEGRLRYWERLRLVRPRTRWGARFYSFGDLVSLQSLQKLIDKKISAKRVRQAISLIEEQFDSDSVPLHELQMIEWGGELLIVPPGERSPFDPVRKQWAFAFDAAPPTSRKAKLHAMTPRTPEELFESALQFESTPEMLPEAAANYRRVLELAPDWIEAHINLGVALYQMGHAEKAREAFASAVDLDPNNAISQYNLGCVLEEMGRLDDAVEHLTIAAKAMPSNADVHFNLALAYEKKGLREQARAQWLLYLRYAPNGPWAAQARAHLKLCTARKPSAPIPFRRKS
jgi:tetratricopeptide (TPR) repeat protein